MLAFLARGRWLGWTKQERARSTYPASALVHTERYAKFNGSPNHPAISPSRGLDGEVRTWTVPSNLGVSRCDYGRHRTWGATRAVQPSSCWRR